jgi:hypothetical protein
MKPAPQPIAFVFRTELCVLFQINSIKKELCKQYNVNIISYMYIHISIMYTQNPKFIILKIKVPVSAVFSAILILVCLLKACIQSYVTQTPMH